MTKTAELIQVKLRHRYADVAMKAAGLFPYPVGRESAERLGYRRALLDFVPPSVVDLFVGVGNPFSLGEPQPGWAVLDIGCGAASPTLASIALIVMPAGFCCGAEPERHPLTQQYGRW
jgi:arsenite methyltransferase